MASAVHMQTLVNKRDVCDFAHFSLRQTTVARAPQPLTIVHSSRLRVMLPIRCNLMFCAPYMSSVQLSCLPWIATPASLRGHPFSQPSCRVEEAADQALFDPLQGSCHQATISNVVSSQPNGLLVSQCRRRKHLQANA